MIFNARNKILGAILVFLATLSLSFPVFAESKSLSISPQINYFNRTKKETEEFDLAIENSSEENLKLKIYTAPYSILNENFETSFEDKDRTDYNEITDWIYFKDKNGEYKKNIELSLEKSSTKNIRYKIDFEESEKWEQYCVIFVEIAQEDNESTFRLASFVVAHDFDKEEKFEINNFKDNRFEIRNLGENDTKISYEFEIDSIFGKKLYEEKNKKIIYPESTRPFEFSWENIPSFGIFKQKLTLETKKGIQAQEKIIIKIPVFLKIIMVLLLTLIIFMLIIKNKNRKECGDSSVQNKNN